MEMSFGYGRRKALKQVTKSYVLLNKHNIRHIAGSAMMATGDTLYQQEASGRDKRLVADAKMGIITASFGNWAVLKLGKVEQLVGYWFFHSFWRLFKPLTLPGRPRQVVQRRIGRVPRISGTSELHE